MERFNIELLSSAYSDLDEIFDYILADNPQAVGIVLEKMMQSLSYLETFPNSGAPLLERSLKRFNFRMVIFDSYIAYYRLIENKILVYRILHGARYYPTLLEEAMK